MHVKTEDAFAAKFAKYQNSFSFIMNQIDCYSLTLICKFTDSLVILVDSIVELAGVCESNHVINGNTCNWSTGLHITVTINDQWWRQKKAGDRWIVSCRT